MIWLEIYGSATLLGLMVGAVSALWIYHRLVVHLRNHNSVLTTALELERRRETIDSGRTYPVREHAGAPATIKSLSITRSGTLARNRLDKSN